MVDLIKNHLTVNISDFEKLRILSKSKAYKLSTIEKLFEKISKREQGIDECYDVKVSDHLVIKLNTREEEYLDKYSNNEIDITLIRNKVFMSRSLRKKNYLLLQSND